MNFKTETLSPAAVSVLEQLFLRGPTWDGNIVSKSGRDEIIRSGLAFREGGWASLTSDGVRVAAEWDLAILRKRADDRWYRKASMR